MNSSIVSVKITFIGAGSMAEAVIRGLVEKAGVPPAHIRVINRQNADRLAELKQRYGVGTASGEEARAAVVRDADLVVLAMKPKDVASGLAGMRGLLHPGQLIVSMVAGLSISTIHDLLRSRLPVVRTMPNTSSHIGLGATGLSFSQAVEEPQQRIALEMFRSMGTAVVVEEALLDTVTGVSGSGPAYVYYLIESMIRGGIEGGLAPEAARELTIQTVLGAAQMVRSTGEDPAELRRKVTSPNGTTQAALETLDRYHFSEAVEGAVRRAAERAGELGLELSNQAARNS